MIEPRPLQAKVRQPCPTVVILDLCGDIDGRGERTLSAAYADAVARNPRALVLNFAEVGYINSTGIALVVGLLGRARNDHHTLVACGLSDHYQEIFEITRLSDFMPIYPNENAALAGALANAPPG